MIITDYFYSVPDRQWEYSSQLGLRIADGRMLDGHMEEIAGSFEKLKAMKELYASRGFDLKIIEPAPPNQKIKQGGFPEEMKKLIECVH